MAVVTYGHDEVSDALLLGVAECGAAATVNACLRTGLAKLADDGRCPPPPDWADVVLTVTPGDPPTLAATVDTAVRRRGRKARADAQSPAEPNGHAADPADEAKLRG